MVCHECFGIDKGLETATTKKHIYIIKLHIIIYILHQTPEGARTCLKQNTHTPVAFGLP
jgi:hypothetical protein